MRVNEQVVVAVNTLNFIPSKSFPVHRYPWHLKFNTLFPRALLKEPRKQKPWTKCDTRPRIEMLTAVSHICYKLLLLTLQCISTYSATIFIRDIHFVLLRSKSEGLDENITKGGGGELE
jgi:hypothetical protein